MVAMKKQTREQQKHAWDRAAARGWAAALTGAWNPYAAGSYCAISFDLAKAKAVRAREQIAREVKGNT